MQMKNCKTLSLAIAYQNRQSEKIMDIGPDPDLSDSDDSFYMGITERPIPVEELSEVEQQRIKLETFYGIVTCNSKKGLLDLLNKGIHVDTNIRDEWTPLLLSCSLGHFEMVTILLAHGADVNQSRGLVTPLMLASSRRTTRSIKSEDIMGIVKLLVENGANVKALDRTRKTALMYAAYEGNLNVVQYLLPLSDREASDNQLWNALTYAVKGKHLDIVKYLISQNFCLDNVDVRGNSLYDIASENNSKEILNLLPKPVLDTVIDDLPCSSTFNEEFYDADETPYLLARGVFMLN
ncbi:hypothetical protein GWI33_002238 [Rhynchophorus ferrugineus]|uniref:Uncharacterized protein n=1 Tax=Rhynchophorus ferrugineus TaxID=354439 RepID=A0A834MFV8_RHYFE|nr:hypothetical protein GWI33_002238 [Rhynchophorus ferrugineus]